MIGIMIRIDPTITVMELAQAAESIGCDLMADGQGVRLERRAPKPRKRKPGAGEPPDVMGVKASPPVGTVAP